MEPASPLFSTQRYSAKKMRKPVNFVCWAPEATSVYLVGDFNEWDTRSHPMLRQPTAHGSFRCRFITAITSIDLWWMANRRRDPRASGVARNRAGERVSLIAVS